MKILEYLYFKYYNLGVKLGSKENASISAILLLSFVFITLDCLFDINMDSRWIVGFIIASFIIAMLVFDFTLVQFDRSAKILTKHQEEWTGKKHLVAILFPAIAFLWFAAALFNYIV